MATLDRSTMYGIIGAGSSGLAIAKNLKERGIPCEVFEREDDVGGNWYYGKPHSSVYRSTHLISSKPLTEYVDYPMPKEYPDYPSHQQVWEYFRSYARHFGLYDLIQFRTSVEHVVPAGEGWDVTIAPVLEDGTVEPARAETRHYRGVIIANGHNWDPKFPDYPGHFDGVSLHSSEYKTTDVLRDKQVLVVGAGNSGCDIAVESAQNAARTYHSVRRGYYYVPKFFFGKPADQIGEVSLRLRIPLPIRRALNTTLLNMVAGDPSRFGLPKPDHKLFETHPIINSQMLYFIGHGDILPKPDVAELFSDHVRFTDGTEAAVDVIIYATGFKITMPFIDKQYLNWANNKPNLYYHVFHPQFDNLFIVGLIQPDSGQWGLVDYQSQLVAEFIQAQQERPRRAAWFRHRKATMNQQLSHGIHYLESTRHYLEIEHFSYRNGLKRMIAQIHR